MVCRTSRTSRWRLMASTAALTAPIRSRLLFSRPLPPAMCPPYRRVRGAASAAGPGPPGSCGVGPSDRGACGLRLLLPWRGTRKRRRPPVGGRRRLRSGGAGQLFRMTSGSWRRSRRATTKPQTTPMASRMVMSRNQCPAVCFHRVSRSLAAGSHGHQDVEVGGGAHRGDGPAGRHQPGELLEAGLAVDLEEDAGEDDLDDGEHHQQRHGLLGGLHQRGDDQAEHHRGEAEGDDREASSRPPGGP